MNGGKQEAGSGKQEAGSRKQEAIGQELVAPRNRQGIVIALEEGRHEEALS